MHSPQFDFRRWANIGSLLRDQAALIGDRELLRFEGASATFSQIEEQTNRLANVLLEHGVGVGDRVAIMLPNGLNFPIAWLATLKIGAVAVSSNVHYREADLNYVLKDSGAVIVITASVHCDLVQAVAQGCPNLEKIGVLDGEGTVPAGVLDLRDEMKRISPSCDVADVDLDHLANVQYTSGTTGFPKGCMLTHGYWLAMAGEIAAYAELNERDVLLTAQPFYYMDPLWNTVVCLAVGIPLVVLPRFSASTFWRAIKENGVTFFYCLGTMPVILLKQPDDPPAEKEHRVRLVLCSGIVPQLHAAMESRWNCPWREVYGTTEVGGVLAVPQSDTQRVGSGSMGTPMSGRVVKLVDEKGDEVADDEVGELLVHGGPMMLGYYDMPEATAKWMMDGWAHTGDLMSRDARGYYRMVGRIKDMIRRGGENIAAAEVEGVLCEHPAVYAAACVPVPDEILGEEVKAFIQLRPDSAAQSVTPQEILDFALSKLAAFKTPRFIEFVGDMPMTPSERIEKHVLLTRKEDQRAGTYDARR